MPEEHSPHDTNEALDRREAALAKAKADLERMTPEDLLALHEYIQNLEEQVKIGEAGGIAFSELVTSKGLLIHVTARAVDPKRALEKLLECIMYASKTWGIRPNIREGYVRAERPPAAPAKPLIETEEAKMEPTVAQAELSAQAPVVQPVAPMQAQLSAQPAAAPQDQPQAQQQAARSRGDRGTDVLHKIIVTKENIQFYVGAFKGPFTDARIRLPDGAQIVSSLFDPSLGFTEEHFKVEAVYSAGSTWTGTLYVDWAREPGRDPSKYYYNVKYVHR